MVKRVISLIFIVFLSANLFADEIKTKSEPPAKSNGIIEGKVIDKGTREELVCAKVILNESQQELCTDIHGNFKFDNLAPGHYEITVKYISYKDKSIQKLKIKANNKKEIVVDLEPL